MLIGCIFCHHAHAVKGTLNTHLNLYVPEMALARGVPHEEDAQHHVGMIRELRWAVRNRLEPSIEWRVSPDDEERAVLQAYSTLIYHPVDRYERDAFRCRSFRKVTTDFWSTEIRAALAEYRSLPLASRRAFLASAVQASLHDALSTAAMRRLAPEPLHADPAAALVRSIAGGTIGHRAGRINPIDANTGGPSVARAERGRNIVDTGGRINPMDINIVLGDARRVGANIEVAKTRVPAVLDDSGSDDEMPDPSPLRRRLQRRNQPVRTPAARRNGRAVVESDEEDDEDEPRLPTRRRHQPVPQTPVTTRTGKGKANARALHLFSSDTDDTPPRVRTNAQKRTTTRSPSVFASPTRKGTRPNYTSTAKWNVPSKRAVSRSLTVEHDDEDEDAATPEPFVAPSIRRQLEQPKTPSRKRTDNQPEDAAPASAPAAPTISPPIEPLLKLTITVLGSYTAHLRIYPGIGLRGVLDRAFADAPRSLVALRASAGIRGAGSVRLVNGWKTVWDDAVWSAVLQAARGCARAPEWRADVLFVGE